MHAIDARNFTSLFINRRTRMIAVAIAAVAVFGCFAASASAQKLDTDACSVTLSPADVTADVSAPPTITATVMSCAATPQPVVGDLFTFVVTSGPDAGQTDQAHLDANGQAAVTLPSTVAGDDQIKGYVEQTICSSDLADGQTIDDCPIADQTQDEVDGFAVTHWTVPVVTPTPTVVTPVLAATAAPAAKTPVVNNSVTVAPFGKKCMKSSLKFTPKFTGTVKSAVLYLDGKKIETFSKGSFHFSVKVKKLAKGSFHKLKLTTVFTDGTKIIQQGSFTKCA